MACESCSKTGMVMVFGEITTKAKVDYEAIVRKTCEEIGFTSEAVRPPAPSRPVSFLTLVVRRLVWTARRAR